MPRLNRLSPASPCVLALSHARPAFKKYLLVKLNIYIRPRALVDNKNPNENYILSYAGVPTEAFKILLASRSQP